MEKDLYTRFMDLYDELKKENNYNITKKTFLSDEIDQEINKEEKQRIDLIKKILVIQDLFSEKVHSYLDRDLLSSFDLKILKEIFNSYEVTDEQIFQKMFKN